MKKQRSEVVAAIDVGSNLIRMLIAEITPEGTVINLEDLRKSAQIGRDTFNIGKVGSDAINDTCEILNGFSKVMDDYMVKKYRAVSTSGIREASNREYVLDRIKFNTGLDVQIINDAEERFIMYKAIWSHMKHVHKMQQEGVLTINVGSGGIEVSVFSDGHLKFTEYIKAGPLRLREMLADIEKTTLGFPYIMEEFIESKIMSLRGYIEKLNIKNFIGLGGGLATIFKLCLPKEDVKEDKFMTKQVLGSFCSDIFNKTPEMLVEEYNIPKARADILLPSTIIFTKFLGMTSSQGIYAPMVSLRHGIIADIADEWLESKRKDDSIEDIVSSVWFIAQKYGVDRAHTRQVRDLALSIFDSTKRIHRLGEKEKLYLHIASILHDVGEFISINNHHVHSYNIIRSQDIIGLSNDELNIVANAAMYHFDENPSRQHQNYKELDGREKVVVSKLAAILKLSEALDVTHKQKIKEIKISSVDRIINFEYRSSENTLLEEWTFKQNALFFEEVMGYKPIIKNRG